MISGRWPRNFYAAARLNICSSEQTQAASRRTGSPSAPRKLHLIVGTDSDFWLCRSEIRLTSPSSFCHHCTASTGGLESSRRGASLTTVSLSLSPAAAPASQDRPFGRQASKCTDSAALPLLVIQPATLYTAPRLSHRLRPSWAIGKGERALQAAIRSGRRAEEAAGSLRAQRHSCQQTIRMLSSTALRQACRPCAPRRQQRVQPPDLMLDSMRQH